MFLTKKEIKDKEALVISVALATFIGFLIFFLGMYIGVNLGFDSAELKYKRVFQLMQIRIEQLEKQQPKDPRDYWQEYMNRLA